MLTNVAETIEIDNDIETERFVVQSEMQDSGKVSDTLTNAEVGADVFSIAGKKRKLSESAISAEVSTPEKKACTGMGNVKNVLHDHTYCASSCSRLKTKVNELLDQADDLKKKLDT